MQRQENQHNRVSVSEYPLSDLIDWRWPNPSDFIASEVVT